MVRLLLLSLFLLTYGFANEENLPSCSAEDPAACEVPEEEVEEGEATTSKLLRECEAVKEALVLYVSRERLQEMLSPESTLETIKEELTKLAKSYEIYICPTDTSELVWAAMHWPEYRFMLQGKGSSIERAKETISVLLAVGHKRVSVLVDACSVFPKEHIAASFSLLEHSDLVFGPLQKGGFYLIAANRELPNLRALTSDNRILPNFAAKLTEHFRISTGELPFCKRPLTREEFYQRALSFSTTSDPVPLIAKVIPYPKVSIIVPVRNEESSLETFVSTLRQLDPKPEVIFVDGASSDGTPSLLRDLGEKLIYLPPGGMRAIALNRGAEVATGEYLLFLHADCTLTQEAYQSMISKLESGEIEAGAFRFKLERVRRNGLLTAIEGGVKLRNKLFKMAYGDQGFFVTREAYDRIGPYKEIPLMEDVEWFGRMKKDASFAILKEPLETSTRRMRQKGYIRNCISNCCLIALYKLGIKPERLARAYHKKGRR